MFRAETTSASQLSHREPGPRDATPARLRPEVFSSLAGGLLTDAVKQLEPGQSLTAEVKIDDDRGQSVKVGIEVRDGRGAKFYAVLVTLGP
jgi:hypothetical protein